MTDARVTKKEMARMTVGAVTSLVIVGWLAVLARMFPLTGSAVRQAFEHLRGRAGMFGFRFHDLWREAFSRLLEKALNLTEAASILFDRL